MNRAERIQQALQTLSPEHLQVEDESAAHGSGNPTESHFKVVLVATCFADQSQLQRHRTVYQKLDEELNSGLHALALHTYSPQEWAQYSGEHISPPCAHAPNRS